MVEGLLQSLGATKTAVDVDDAATTCGRESPETTWQLELSAQSSEGMAGGRSRGWIQQLFGGRRDSHRPTGAHSLTARLVVVRGEEGKCSAINAADAAASVSGTAVLELALAGVPTVAVYRTSAVTAAIAKRLAVVPFVSLPNLMTFFREQRIEGEREKQHRTLRRAGTDTGTMEVEGRWGDTENTRDVCVEARGEESGGYDGGSRRARLISSSDDGNGSNNGSNNDNSNGSNNDYGVIPELLFDKCTAPAIADQLAQFLAHVRERRRVCDELPVASVRLGGSLNVGRRSSSDITCARLLHSDLVPWVCGRRVSNGGEAAGGEETAITGGLVGGYPPCRPLRPSDVAARVVLQEAMRAAIGREAEVSLL